MEELGWLRKVTVAGGEIGGWGSGTGRGQMLQSNPALKGSVSGD